MAIAKITFEDDNEYVIIGMENVLSDHATAAQKAAFELFCAIKKEARKYEPGYLRTSEKEQN